MDKGRVNTVTMWKEPETFREIQVFLGFCNFYRRFIYNYSNIAAPLSALLKGSKNGKKPGPIQLQPGEKAAFQALKQAFQTAPLLQHFHNKKPIQIKTDASDFAMAAILSQPDNKGVYHPIAFWSWKFSN